MGTALNSQCITLNSQFAICALLTIFLMLVGLPGSVSVTTAQANIVAIFFRNPVLSSVEGAAGGDYRLREESPCVDAAPPGRAPTT